jgi:hypothetical protein
LPKQGAHPPKNKNKLLNKGHNLLLFKYGFLTMIKAGNYMLLECQKLDLAILIDF